MESILAGGVIFYILLVLAPIMIWINSSIIVRKLSRQATLTEEQNLYLRILVKQAAPDLKLPGER